MRDSFETLTGSSVSLSTAGEAGYFILKLLCVLQDSLSTWGICLAESYK